VRVLSGPERECVVGDTPLPLPDTRADPTSCCCVQSGARLARGGPREAGRGADAVALRQAPTVVVLAAVAVGLAVVALGSWRVGSDVVGLAVLLAAALRLTLPEGAAGMLVVRSRGVDALVLVVLGAGLLVLASTVPQP
jgi:Protein of unknown function (DUF3017)